MKNENPEDVSIHSILNQIREGTLDPSTLLKEVRQLAVEALTFEGYLPSAIAQLFKVSDRTIKRDLQDIYEKNALEPSRELGRQLIGEYLQKSRTHHAYLMRLARTKEASIQEKVNAESMAAQTLKDMIKTLQSLGFLPEKPQQIVGDFFHHGEVSNDAVLSDLKKEIAETEVVLKLGQNIPPQVFKRLEELKLKLDKAQIQEEILKITDQAKADGKEEAK